LEASHWESGAADASGNQDSLRRFKGVIWLLNVALYPVPMAFMPQETAMSPSILTFLPELDNHVSADFYALKACSLVCRAWYTTCQAHLFHTVIIRNEAMFLRFQELIIKSPRIPDSVRTL